jgi:hypothetical protein
MAWILSYGRYNFDVGCKLCCFLTVMSVGLRVFLHKMASNETGVLDGREDGTA